jgi:vacuolar-type H+-ATPase subunit D/Vma8
MITAPCNNCKILRKKKKELQRKLRAMHDKVDNLNQKITSNQKDWINTFEQLSQRPVMVETGKIILLIDHKLKEIKIDIYSNLLHLTYYSYRCSNL